MKNRFHYDSAGEANPIRIEQVFAEKPGGGLVVDPGFDAPEMTAVGKNSSGKYAVIKSYLLVSEVKAEDTTIEIAKGSGLTGEQIDRSKPRNMEALSVFQERKVNGMQLSENVWTIVDNGKTEFELALDVALGDGRSAAMLSRDVRKYLKDPAMLFRRVRGKDGVLRLSERARNYHPGQGVYRSSYKNAMRLARTEVNMAYHTADYEAWKDNDLVLGYEIILSNNHIPDICDELAGKYPKDFKFVGWHPQCRCVAVPITPSQEELLKYAKAELNGEDVSDYQFEEVDFDGPAKLEGWAEENRERAKGWANMPYFVSDNPQYVSFTEKKTAMEIAEERHAVRTQEDVNELLRKWGNFQTYLKYKNNPDYKDVEFDHSSGGVKASHIRHNFDKKKGWYETKVQEIGASCGHSVILEREDHTRYKVRNTEGTWDGMVLEIAAAENGETQNIRNALKHCASKKNTEVAVVLSLNDLSDKQIIDGLNRYNGLKGKEGQLSYPRKS